jgi:hypothetical protein
LTIQESEPDIYLEGLPKIQGMQAFQGSHIKGASETGITKKEGSDIEICADAPENEMCLATEAKKPWYSVIIDNIISSGASMLNVDKNVNGILCPYKVRSSKTHGVITVNCKECAHGPTFQSPVCRKNIFNILLKEPVSYRLVLSKLYERDYEGRDLNVIYMMAQLHDRLSSYSTARLTDQCRHYIECRKCASSRLELITDIITTSGHDPLRASFMIRLHCDPHNLINMSETRYKECEKCLHDFKCILQEMATCSLELERGLHNAAGPADCFEVTGYETCLRSYVRPPFSTSRIYTEPPDNTIFVECYDIDHINERSLPVSIYQLTDRPEKMYIINPVEYCLEADELEIIETVRKKMIRHRPKDLHFANPSSSRNYFKILGRRLVLEEAELRRMPLEPSKVKLYTDILTKYTTGLGILEDLLSDERVTDVYVNAPADRNPVHVVLDGEECITNIFLSQDNI